MFAFVLSFFNRCGNAAAPAPEEFDEKVSPHMNCYMTTKPIGCGCVSTQLVSFELHKHNFVLFSQLFSILYCACCDRATPDVDDSSFCPYCKAPVCAHCASLNAQENRCKWCLKPLFPLFDGDGNIELLKSSLNDALDQSIVACDWICNIRRNHKDFDFQRICWQRYFDAIGWFFFVEAEWFFQVNLPRQYEVVIGNIVTRRRFRDFDALKRIRNPFYTRFKTEEKEPEFFSDSTNSALMYTIAIKLLERMKNCYSFTVLKRLRAKHAERLSIRLGVYLPPPPPEQDSDGEL
jgi:hypothetical protein